jgi:hypothetical protein
MRGETMGAPDLLHGADRHPHGLSHCAARPMSGLAGWRAERERDQSPDDRLGDRRFAGLARLVVQQAIDPGFHKAALPAPHAGLRHAGPVHYLGGAAAFRRGQDDPRSPHMLLDSVAIGHHRLKPLPIPRSEPDFNIAAHPRAMAGI